MHRDRRTGGSLAAASTLRASRLAIACALAVPLASLPAPSPAKTPGSTYCFINTCHRVKTIEETRALVGKTITMHASFYDDAGKDSYNPSNLTSSGEYFRSGKPDNAASPIFPDGTKVLVWHPGSKRAIIVRINNAGPYWGSKRLIDLSRAGAERLGFTHSGVSTVHVKVLEAPTRAEATYRRGRTYEPVPGYIGAFASMDDALLDAGRRLARNFGPAPVQVASADPVTARLGPLSSAERDHDAGNTGVAVAAAKVEVATPAELGEDAPVVMAVVASAPVQPEPVAAAPVVVAAAPGEPGEAAPHAQPAPADAERAEAPTPAPATLAEAQSAEGGAETPLVVAAVPALVQPAPAEPVPAAPPVAAPAPVAPATAQIASKPEPKPAASDRKPTRVATRPEPKTEEKPDKPVVVAAAKPDADQPRKPAQVARKPQPATSDEPAPAGKQARLAQVVAPKPVVQPSPVRIPQGEGELDRRVWFRTALSLN